MIWPQWGLIPDSATDDVLSPHLSGHHTLVKVSARAPVKTTSGVIRHLEIVIVQRNKRLGKHFHLAALHDLVIRECFLLVRVGWLPLSQFPPVACSITGPGSGSRLVSKWLVGIDSLKPENKNWFNYNVRQITWCWFLTWKQKLILFHSLYSYCYARGIILFVELLKAFRNIKSLNAQETFIETFGASWLWIWGHSLHFTQYNNTFSF